MTILTLEKATALAKKLNDEGKDGWTYSVWPEKNGYVVEARDELNLFAGAL